MFENGTGLVYFATAADEHNSSFSEWKPTPTLGIGQYLAYRCSIGNVGPSVPDPSVS